MRVSQRLMVWVVLLCGGLAWAQDATKPAFDPQKHMRVDEVKMGMRGYGLTVFKGTKIERFDVEVVAILKNFNPKRDVILIRCDNEYLKHTGPVAGMSGSPIYLKDEAGRERMVGAFAYGWPSMKDPIAGVQPIEYMLDLQPPKKPVGEDVQPGGGGAANNPPAGMVRWNLTDSVPLPGSMAPAPKAWPLATWGELSANPLLGNPTDRQMNLQRMATPVMTGGIPPRVFEKYAPLFKQYGMMPLQAGGGQDAQAANDPKPEFAPGSVLVVPILTGDVDMTAVGTTTEVLGNNVYGFGHPFFNEGPVQWPMGTGFISEIIASLTTSFKIGSLSETRGTLFADEISGVAGSVGPIAQTIPIDIQVTYEDGSKDLKFHFDSAAHPRFTPLIMGLAISSAVSSARELPQYHTLTYDVTMEFENGQSVHIVNTAANESADGLFSDLALPMVAAAENPFATVMMKKATGKVIVSNEARAAEILSVNVPRLKYQPGETVKAYVTYRPFRAPEGIMEVQMELPRDLSEGVYQLTLSDWQNYIAEEAATTPFRFTAESADQLFDVVREVTAIRRDALYLRLLRQADGVAIGRTALPQLPSSRRQVLMDAGRSNTSAFISSTVKKVPTNWVMTGSAGFEITIDKNAKVEIGGAPGTKPETPVPPSPEKEKESPSNKPKPAPKSDSAESEK